VKYDDKTLRSFVAGTLDKQREAAIIDQMAEDGKLRARIYAIQRQAEIDSEEVSTWDGDTDPDEDDGWGEGFGWDDDNARDWDDDKWGDD